jgi:Rieske Fe-S protein
MKDEKEDWPTGMSVIPGSMSRRTFLSTAAKSLAAAPVVAVLSRTRVSAAQAALPAPIVLDLTKAAYSALNTVGGYIKIPDPNNSTRPMIVGRTSATVALANSSQCTFDGCELPFPVNGIYTCPCCGSQYDVNGKVIKGPASTDLTKYRAQIDTGFITILFGTEPVRNALGFVSSFSQVRVAVRNNCVYVILPHNNRRWAVTVCDGRGALVYNASAPAGSTVHWDINHPYGLYTIKAQCEFSSMFSHSIVAGF